MRKRKYTFKKEKERKKERKRKIGDEKGRR
jgi:hypothetical protein